MTAKITDSAPDQRSPEEQLREKHRQAGPEVTAPKSTIAVTVGPPRWDPRAVDRAARALLDWIGDDDGGFDAQDADGQEFARALIRLILDLGAGRMVSPDEWESIGDDGDDDE